MPQVAARSSLAQLPGSSLHLSGSNREVFGVLLRVEGCVFLCSGAEDVALIEYARLTGRPSECSAWTRAA